jgi:hypothetical protein
MMVLIVWHMHEAYKINKVTWIDKKLVHVLSTHVVAICFL